MPSRATLGRVGAGFLACSLFSLPHPLSAQGSLTAPPRGPPAPRYRTFLETEPHTPLNAATAPGDGTAVPALSSPGNDCLTGDIAGASGRDGIRIATAPVTLDLGGFALRGVPGSGHAIFGDGVVGDVAIRGGTIVGWGGVGIEFLNTLEAACVFAELQLRDLGGAGIWIGLGVARAEGLTVVGAGRAGVRLRSANPGRAERIVVRRLAHPTDLVGITAAVVAHSIVESISAAAGTATGIIGDHVEQVRVQEYLGPLGASGIVANTTIGATVDNFGAVDAGSLHGINATALVRDARVSNQFVSAAPASPAALNRPRAAPACAPTTRWRARCLRG